MAQPIHDHPPIPHELAMDDEPLSTEVLARLDEAFAAATDDGVTELSSVLLDPLTDEGAPAAAHLVPDEIRRWSIDDDGAAEWAMRHVAEIDGELLELTERRDDWQARIDGWFAQRSQTSLRRRAFFQAHLVSYGERRRAANPKGPATLVLPSGRITSRTVKPVVRCVDDETLAAWLAERELLVAPDGADVMKVSTKVYATPLRKVLAPAGDGIVIVPTGEVLKPAEIPAGLVVDPEHTDYDVKPS